MDISIHGHFYQPERRDPFTNDIPNDVYVMQISKQAQKNWNERINAQCYAPNAKLDNFSDMSFDLVRPLAEWLSHYDTTTYHAILDSAHKVYTRDKTPHVFASSWDHAILPLLNDIDLQLEVCWGLKDFRRRFGFAAEAFWLPETAASYRVLDVLAAYGIRLTILSPLQATQNIDPGKFWRVSLNQNKFIDVAFFHKEFSDRLSFDNPGMADAITFAQNIQQYAGVSGGFLFGATDGERYGHHLEGGAQFLHHFMTKGVESIQSRAIPITTRYLHTTDFSQMTIQDNSSWSCLCGNLIRWQGDCNCCLDYNDGNKRVDGTWKKHLVQAIRGLSDSLWGYSHSFFVQVLRDPLSACKDFVSVMLAEMSESDFLSKHAMKDIDDASTRKLFLLLEMQKYRLAAFTSCGTFFWNVDRPEPRIVIHQAKKALSYLAQIHEHGLMYKLEEAFVQELEKAVDYKSGITGKQLYEESGHLYRSG